MKKVLLLMILLMFLVLNIPVKAQLTGTKNIPGDYATLAAAIADLNIQGVGSGGVTFNVAAGHTETITATLVLTATGTAANPIVFQKSGAGANPLITAYTGTSTPGSTTQDGIWALVGSDYVTIDGIDLLDPNTTNPATMEYGYGLFKASVTDGCQNVTIQNCTITLNRVNNASGTLPVFEGSKGIEVVNATRTAHTTALTPTSSAGSNSFNKFYSNTIQNCNYGIGISGFAATVGVGPSPDPSTFLGDLNNDIGGTSSSTGNTILNYGGAPSATNPAAGIRVNNQWSVNISYNTINNNNGSGVNHVSTLRGIFAQAGTSANATITYNNITIKGGGTTSQVAAIENGIGSTAAGNTININNNTVTGDYLTATSGAFYGIYSTASAATVNINNNTVQNLSYSASSLAGSGAVYPIWNSGAATTVNANNNTVNNITRTGTTGGTTIGIYISGGATQNANGNTISNMSIDGSGTASTMYGIQTVTGTVTVNNNNISSLQCIKASGTSPLYGIYNISSPTNETINNNNVNNLTHNGTGIVYGIYHFTVTGTRTMSSNTVHTITGAGTTIAGINNASSSPSVFRNNVYNISSTSTAAPTVSGIIQGSLGTSGVAYIYNNFVSDIKAPNANNATAAVRGINITTATATTNLYLFYNTVYLNATSTGTDFGTAALFVTASATATTANLTMRNNIFVNNSTANGTGFTVAYQRSSTDLANYNSASNNNLFYAGTPSTTNLIFRDGTNNDQTIGAYKTRVAPRDANSVTENPPFVNVTTTPYDLHINTSLATQVESGGVPISSPISINVDFDGDTRNASTPDIGADEFSGTPADFTPPNIIYTPLANTGSLSSRTIVATVTDPSGVPTSDPGMPRLYWKINFSGSYSAAVPTYLGSNQYQYSFGSGVAAGDTVYYYFVARDQAGTPNIGSAPGGASGFTYDPPAASTPPPSPSSYRILTTISGTVTVGSGGTYPSLTGAGGLFEAINSNLVNGNIVANVISDLSEDGTNALNQWIEDPDGSNFTVTIQPSAATERLILGNVATGMIRLNGADRVTFDGRFSGFGSYLRFRNTNTSDPTFKFLSGASNNTIRNCIIEGVATSTSDGVIYFGGTANNNNKILSCDIRDRSDAAGKPATGIYFSSASDSGNTIMSCNIFNFNQYSVYISAATNTTIDSCNTFMTTASTSSTVYNIYIVNAVGTKILKNKIYDINGSSSATIKGIYFAGSSSRPVDVRIENNSISLSPTTTGSVDGIDYFGYASNSAFIYYNSIYIGGTATAGSSYGIRYRDDVNAYVQYNNVVFNARTGGTGKHYAMYFDNSQPFVTLNMDYNDYFASGTNGYLGYWGTDISVLATWKTTSNKDTNSISADPLYNSTSNLQPLIGSPVIGVGLPIAGISTDILNNPRSGSNPSMGAYEIAGDFAAPAISYTPLLNTTSLANRTLTPVTITDASGVNGTSGTAPRIYYKKKTDANVFGANNSSFSGWKWTESTGSSPFTFTIDYSIIFGGSVSAGDTIQYFVVAQDLASTPNVGANPSAGFSATSVSSISSAPTTPNFYKIVGAPLSGDYTVGLLMFNKLSGKNLKYEKLTRTIMKDVEVSDNPTEAANTVNEVEEIGTIKDEKTTFEALTFAPKHTIQKLVTEEYYALVDNGLLYDGPTFIEANSTEGNIEGVYATLTAAINDLNDRGAAGNVRFLLNDPTFNEASTMVIDITTNDTLNASRTLTIKPNTGVTTLITTNSSSPVFIVAEHYVTFDGSNTAGGSSRDMTITNSGTATTSGVAFVASSSNVTFKNIIGSTNSSSTSYGIVYDASNNGLVENCELKKATLGVQSQSSTNNFTVRKNLIGSSVAADKIQNGGIIILSSTNFTVDSNKVFGVTRSSTASIAGVLVGVQTGGIAPLNGTISRNDITDIKHTGLGFSAWGAFGIQLSSSDPLANITVANNMISDIWSDGDAGVTFAPHGIYINNGGGYKIYHNSVNLFGNLTGDNDPVRTGALTINFATAANLDIRNNILINSQEITGTNTTAKSHAIYSGSPSTAFTNINYNNYYAPNVNDGVLGYLGGDIPTLSGWKAATGKDANSVSLAVTFVGATDLHLSGGSVQDPYLAGTPIPGITTDIDGQARSTTFPYKGADESTAFNVYNLNLTVLIEAMYDGSTMVPDTVVVELRNTSLPYSLVDQASVVLNASGNGTASYLFAANAVNYYITIKHRNALQTWSATGQAFSGGTLNYNFTTSASQAYGSNQVLVGTKYCLYSGDVSDGVTAGIQDGYIDIFDDFEVYNDSYSATYRLLTDLNLDGFVDIFDDLYVYNNSYNGVTASYPGFPRPGFLKKDTSKIKINKEVE